MAKQQVKVVTGKNDEPTPVGIIERSIVEISKAMQAINKTRLTRKALIVLIHDHSKIARRDIEIVLNCLEHLEEVYLKKNP
jgi:hypothetical protein